MRSLKYAVSVMALVGLAVPFAQADPVHPGVVNIEPTNKTPALLDGTVNAVIEVGAITLAGGTFTQAASVKGATVAANKLVAFDSQGQLIPGFDAGLDGDVYSLTAGPTPGTVIVGGAFNNAGGILSRRVALLDAATGQAISGFKSPGFNGVVREVERVGNRIYVGGTFTTAGTAAHSGLASLNATTGAVDPYMNVQLTERHNNTGSGAQAGIGSFGFDVSPDGTQMAVIGNFRKADGLDRVQAAVLDLGSTGASVSSWATTRYEPLCAYRSFDTYVRDVAYSPTSDYFAVASTGGGYPGTLCDTVARFEAKTTGANQQPTWITDSGGDTFLSVAVSGPAVYFGGHNRWVNNAGSIDRAGAGAVARPGMGALDPDSGLPLAWNPGRNPRGAGASAMVVTDTNLWVGSDTEWIGNYKYKRPRLAQFRLAGGIRIASDAQLGLPGRVYAAGTAGSATGLSASQFDGTTVSGSADTNALGLDWSKVRGAFYAGGKLYYGWSTGTMYSRTFNGSQLGAATELDPYHDPVWMNVDTGSGNTFNGATVNFYSQIPGLTGMTYGKDRLYYTRSGNGRLFWRWFNVDSGTVGAEEFTVASTGFDNTKALMYAEGTLYQVTSASSMSAWPLSGLNLGSPTTVATTTDWQSKALFVGPVPSQPPTAKATADCTDLTCTVSGAGSSDPEGGALTYSWDFGDGTPAATGLTATHDYARAGTFTVTLTVTDPAGVSTTTTTQATAVAPPAAPVAAASADCTDLTCAFDGSASSDANGDALTYSWDFGDGTPAQTGVTATHAYAAAGSYNVTLTVTDTTGRTGTRSIVAVATKPVEKVTHVGTTATSSKSSTNSAAMPSGVRAGDLLLLTGTFASSSARPSVPAGWTVAGSTTSNGLSSYVWTRRATDTDEGTTVAVGAGGSMNSSLTLAAYRGVSTTTNVSQIRSATAWWAGVRSPRLTSRGDGVLVEVFGSSARSSTSLSTPSGTTLRGNSSASSGFTRTAGMAVDSATTGGTVGGHTAGVSGMLNSTVAWSIELLR